MPLNKREADDVRGVAARVRQLFDAETATIETAGKRERAAALARRDALQDILRTLEPMVRGLEEK